ncbi:hypothetical protein V9T40_006879 [Parthenolecanium corni]|uniref:Uncharacterized protein n=1 Tax=Parthenolecanium corni TaxID=536013 RepID=A0AAN9TUC4_9HEMI
MQRCKVFSSDINEKSEKNSWRDATSSCLVHETSKQPSNHRTIEPSMAGMDAILLIVTYSSLLSSSDIDIDVVFRSSTTSRRTSLLYSFFIFMNHQCVPMNYMADRGRGSRYIEFESTIDIEY